MGHRANLVVVDADGWRLYYSHWAANGIYRQLAAGPDAALAFALAQSQQDPRDGWLDDVWCEGGAVIDSPAQRLLWYGNDWMSELPARRAYLRLLAETWPGWRIDWADDGIGDLAAHVGIDRAAVRKLDMSELAAAPVVAYEFDELRRSDSVELPVNHQGSYELLTVRSRDRLAVWVLEHQRDGHLAWLGPALFDQLPGPGFARLRLGALPAAGLHVDLGARQVGIWTGGICPGLLPTLDALWRGWSVTFWHDRYERQLAAAEQTVIVPACDEGAAMHRLAESLCPTSWDRTGPLVSAADLIGRYRAAGKDVEVNPAAWQHADIRPGERDLTRLAQALAKVAADLEAGPTAT